MFLHYCTRKAGARELNGRERAYYGETERLHATLRGVSCAGSILLLILHLKKKKKKKAVIVYPDQE